MQPKRVLILGVGPVPLDNPEFLHGTCLRTWQLTRTLHHDGHELFLICFRVTGSRGAKDFSARKEIHEDRLRYLSLTEAEFFYLPLIRQFYDQFRPDCVVGANTYPSSILAQIGPEAPFWADINGYHMGEAQAKAARYDDDYYVKYYWDVQLPALLAGDHFSVTATPQKAVLVGELDVAGRLNSRTFGQDLVSVIPTGREAGPERARRDPARPPQLRGPVVPVDAFIALWLGGYNLWYDMDTLFAGLESALARNPRIHYVSTGGTIEGHDDFSFERLRRLIERSPHRDHYHFLGWVPLDRVEDLCGECDLGLNVDRICYEALFGARNRITDMMRLGLPVLTTAATEISEVVGAEGCGYTFAPGDAAAMAQALIHAAEHPEELAARGAKGRQVFERRYTLSEAGRPLREWVGGSPQKAGDWRRPNAAGWPMPLREAERRKMSLPRRLAYDYARFGARGLWAKGLARLKRSGQAGSP